MPKTSLGTGNTVNNPKKFLITQILCIFNTHEALYIILLNKQ